MTDIAREPKLVLPFLQRFYDFVIPLSWPIVAHRLRHASRHPRLGQGDARRHVSSSTLAFGLFLTFIEFFGGICITIGLFTRFFAAAAAIEMGYLTFIQYWANGYGWRNDGYEYVMMWGTLAFAIALRGGGPYSVDRVLGREL